MRVRRLEKMVHRRRETKFLIRPPFKTILLDPLARKPYINNVQYESNTLILRLKFHMWGMKEDKSNTLPKIQQYKKV